MAQQVDGDVAFIRLGINELGTCRHEIFAMVRHGPRPQGSVLRLEQQQVQAADVFEHTVERAG